MSNFLCWRIIFYISGEYFFFPAHWLGIMQRFCEVSGVGKKVGVLPAAVKRLRLRALAHFTVASATLWRQPKPPLFSNSAHFAKNKKISTKWVTKKYHPKKNITKTKLSSNGSTIISLIKLWGKTKSIVILKLEFFQR